MTSLSKIQQRKIEQNKETVFSIMDDLKKAGGSFNADKVARLSAMGKQTILPHYNEWRYLEKQQEKDPEELPENIIQALKRTMIRWKLELSRELLEIQSTFENSKEDFISKIDHLNIEKKALEETLNSQLKTLDRKEKESKDNIENISYLKNKNALLTKEISDINKTYNQQIDDITLMKEKHKKNIINQEKKLNKAHELQVNNWIRLVESEKKQTQNIISKNMDQQKEIYMYQKNTITLENKISILISENNKLKETNILIKNECKKNEKNLQYLSEIQFLFNCDVQHIQMHVENLINNNVKFKSSDKNLKKIKKEIEVIKEKSIKLKQENKELKKIELEFEKTKGYVEGLEKIISVNPNKENKKQP